jgi:uncharacterized protein YbjT (DUF2867 family)
MDPILVTGGTGRLGSLVVDRLVAHGVPVRVLSRQHRASRPGATFVAGDLVADRGLAAALDGCATVVHCATDRKGDAAAARHLVRAAPPGAHLVLVSIVGIERVSFGYYRTKLDVEDIVTGSGHPWTVVRATQFHEFILGGLRGLVRLPAVPVPSRFPVRPVDTGEVADRVVARALGEPAGRVPDVAGPEVRSFADLARGYLRHRGSRRPVVPIRLPGLGAVAAGGLLPDPDTVDAGRITWEEFLARRS